MGHIEALEDLADGSSRPNRPTLRVPGLAWAAPGARGPLAGVRLDRHKFLYKHHVLDGQAGGGGAVASRFVFRASAIASPSWRLRARAQPSWWSAPR